jgi:hypothetical protein
MKSTKQKKIQGYVDPVNGFSNRELSISEWYVRNKILLEQILTWCIGAVAFVTMSFSLFSLVHYIIVGLPQERALYAGLVQGAQNYEAMQISYAAQPLQVRPVAVYEAGPDAYTFAAQVRNPNAQHVATLTYYLVYSGGRTETRTTTLLPGEQRPVVFVGEKTQQYPANISFVISETSYRRVDLKAISDIRGYVLERTQFIETDVVFDPPRPSEGITGGTVSFSIENASAYSYWKPQFVIELLYGGRTVGMLKTTLRQFRAGEVRPVSVRTEVETLTVDDIRVYPVINIFDQSVYIPPGQ